MNYWKYVLLSSFFLMSSLLLNAQDSRFFIPSEIRQAYASGTRSYDGKPGANYWQNTADYRMEVSFDQNNKQLSGSQEVVYYNNSPDDLNTLVIRLYYDAYKKGNLRASSIDPEEVTDGVDLKELTINGQAYDLENPREVSRTNTNMVIQLREPLKAGEKLSMSSTWSQWLPSANGRTGAYDETTFFIAYWFPQVAVYDDVFGWDQLPFDFQAEFYNNLGNFDVTIQVPEAYTVWATGVLQNAETVLPDAVRERWEQAQTATETVHILTADDLGSDYRNKSGTWHYQAENVTDFAFAVSDHYCWDAAAQQVDGRDVLISTVFPDNDAEAYAEVTALQQKTMKHFSEDIPGIPYPYPAFTSFIGLFGGGMEFPMMANNDGPGRGVTIHEMFHTYFPMYVRINEKRFAWMDEGWADFMTTLVTERFWEDNPKPVFTEFSYIQGTMGSMSDLPLITSTQFMDASNYGYASYPLPAFFYSMLHFQLGDELFLKSLRTYMKEWAEKSPTPYDFFYTFERVSGQDLAWLYQPWFFEFGYPDIAITSYKKGKLKVENRGNRPVPLVVSVSYEDGETEEITAAPSIWKDGKPYAIKIPNASKIKTLTVNGSVPDGAILDNYYPPLTQRYEGISLPDDLTGTYPLNEIPFSVLIEEKEQLLHLRIPGGGVSTYLVPKSRVAFESLDGNIQVNFKEEEGAINGLSLDAFGYTFTSDK